MLAPGQFSFDIVRPIGQGGLGIVEEIRVTATNHSHPVGTRLARKRLGPQWAAHPEARARFELEIGALQTMQHPNIISFEGQNISGERFYCMPLCESSYRDLLNTNPAGFEWTSVARIGVTLATALQYAHSLGFIHRDLKPENLLLDFLRSTYIADWGLGYFIHKDSKVLRLTQAGELGTSYYCSLEQWSSGKCDARGDIYSLGITLAELVRSANRPQITIGMGIREDIVPPTSSGAKIFNGLIRQMTAPLAGNRLHDMQSVATVLNQAVAASQYNWT